MALLLRRKGLEDSSFLFVEDLLELVSVDGSVLVDVEHVEHFLDSSLIEIALSIDGSLQKLIVVDLAIFIGIE